MILDFGPTVVGQSVVGGYWRDQCVLVRKCNVRCFLRHFFARHCGVLPCSPSSFVKLHNDMQRASQKGGFSLLNHNVHPMLLEDASFHKFNEMSTIGPWIDRQGKLQWDYVTGGGFKGSRNVRNGNLRRAELIESDGYRDDTQRQGQVMHLRVPGSDQFGRRGACTN